MERNYIVVDNTNGKKVGEFATKKEAKDERNRLSLKKGWKNDVAETKEFRNKKGEASFYDIMKSDIGMPYKVSYGPDHWKHA